MHPVLDALRKGVAESRTIQRRLAPSGFRMRLASVKSAIRALANENLLAWFKYKNRNFYYEPSRYQGWAPEDLEQEDGRAACSDWLEEQGRLEEANCLRSLKPAPRLEVGVTVRLSPPGVGQYRGMGLIGPYEGVGLLGVVTSVKHSTVTVKWLTGGLAGRAHTLGKSFVEEDEAVQ